MGNKVSVEIELLDRISGNLERVNRKMDELGSGARTARGEMDALDGVSERLKKSLAALGVAFSMKEVAGKIMSVRGEMQQLEVAFGTMLGSAEKADALMAQLVHTAAVTPFGLEDVATGAKQLLAYGTAADEVNGTLVRLGDIAAGLSIPLNDLVYLYGTTMTQGRLYTQDLNQFTGRGIPMIQELAKQFGVADSEVKKLVESGKVGFPEVQKVIESLTGEGSKFGGLMEAQSKTITGQIANIEDALYMMLNDIGQQSEGVINAALGGVSALLENYRQIGRAVLELVGTYGAYKAAVVTLSAIENVRYQSALLHMSGMTKMQVVTDLLRKKTEALNAVMLKNPYALAGAAVAALALGVYKLATYQTEAEKGQKKLNDALKEADQSALGEQSALARLKGELSGLRKGTDEYNAVKEKIVKQFGQYYAGLDEEIERVGLTEAAYDRLTNAIRKTFAARQYEQFAAEQQESLSGTMAENLQKIQERLYKKLGDERGARVYAKIRDGLLSGTISNRTGSLFGIEGFDADTRAGLREASGTGLIQNHAVEGYIDEILRAKKLAEELDKKARERFGVDGTGGTESRTAAATGGGTAAAAVTKAATGDLKAEQAKYLQLLEEQATERKRAAEDLQAEVDAARVRAMADGTEKTTAELELDFEKEMTAIDRAREDALRKKRSDARKAFESNPANKGKTFDAGGVTLTDEEEQAYAALYKAQITEFEKAQKELKDQRERAWREYFIEFGDYQEQRRALVEKYDAELAALAADSPEYAVKTAEKDRALSALDAEHGGGVTAMGDLFEDASRKSVSAIEAIIKKYETLVAYLSGDGGVTVETLGGLGFSAQDLKSIEHGETSVKDLTDALQRLKDTLKGKSAWKTFTTDLQAAIDKIENANGDMGAMGTGISGIGSAVSAFAPAVSAFGSDIANIFGQDDSKITGIVAALDGLGQTATGVGQIMSGDIAGGAMSAVSGISAVVSALDGLFGADYSQYEAMVAEYDTLSDVWDTLIEKKREYVDISYGDEARKTGEEVESLLRKKLESNAALGRELLNAGTSAGSHSIGVRIKKSMSEQGWNELYAAARSIGFDAGKVTDGRMEGLFDLSGDQLSRLQEEAPTFWAKLEENVRGYLEEIIACNDELEEMKETLSETLTGVSFDSFYDGFTSLLTDMDADSATFADDFGEYLRTAILKNLLANKYKSRIEALYEEWAAKSDSDGDGVFDLTAEEASRLREAQQALAEEMLAERDALAGAFDWSESSTTQSGKSGAFTTMTQDQGTKLEGLFTSGLQHWSSMDARMETVAERMTTAESHLARIAENTGTSAAVVSELKSAFEKMVRDGLKVR